EPEIELNNAKLLAITKTTVIVSSTTGERYTLPKEATTFEPPVNWKRTTTIFNDQNNHSHHAGGLGWFVLLLLLAGAGGGGWFWYQRKREGESESGGRPLIVTTKGVVPAGTGKFKLTPLATRSDLAPSSAPGKGSLESDSIDDLIETR